MSRISPREVEHIAHLARLDLGEGERDAMARDLGGILDYVEDLQALDTTGIEPTSHPIPVPTPLRADVAAAPIDPELAVANAPQRAGTAFVVPKVIESDDEG
ncbi:MAG: Asp-tRNA(Asn)/Glu-tRNA(Gln) amidotransferase subunit GatC [Myxococcota bacterium]|nr:Asp-tRNA(Asn)/Glu-tRNA(Gln) amidotransferase subunit GatC [Myxococcales bacterium]